MIDQFLFNIFGYSFNYPEFYFGLCTGILISFAILGGLLIRVLTRRRDSGMN